MMQKIICTILSAALVLLTSCSKKEEQFEVSGQITGAEGKTLYFEASTLNGIDLLDSIRLKKDGDFRFQEASPSNPEFYRLRIEKQVINLSVDSTETIKVTATYPTMGTDYNIEGSPSSLKIKEVSNQLSQLQQTIQNILTNQNITIGEQERLVNEQIYHYKEKMKKEYILKDPAAPCAYFALFQTIGGQLLFNPVNDPEDVKYTGAVATAWEACYPGTARTENLRNIALQGMKNTKRNIPTTLNDIASEKISASGIIEIELPDINGQNRRLSDIKNKVVLLDFMAYSLPKSQERIMQLRQLYDKYASQGFEIYQISIDPDEHYWKTACEYLPWICVYEKDGENSSYLTSYVVQRLPTYFLINKNGDLVARDEQIKDLDATVAQLCAQ